MSIPRKLVAHFRSAETDWASEAFGGVVVAMVAFLCASLFLKIAAIPIILYAIDVFLVVGAVSSLYGIYSAWRMSSKS